MDPALHRRLATLYAGLVGGISGIPFLSVILVDAGWSPSHVAWLMLALPVTMLMVGPAVSLFADRTRGHARLLAWTTLGSAIVLALVAMADAWAMAGFIVLMGLVRAPMSPLADATTVGLLGADRDRYGQYRSWGSLAYAGTMVIAGAIQETWSRGPLWLSAGWLVVAHFAARRLPSPPAPPPRPPAPWAVLRHPVLGPALIVGVLHGATLSTYHAFFALLVHEAHLPSMVTGLALATGVVVEIGVMVSAPRLLGMASPATWMLVGVASSAPRWWATAWVTSGPALVLLQGLHGLGFGAFWIAGVALFAHFAPRGLEGATQALLPASTFGFGALLSMAVAGVVLEHHDLPTLFRLMAGLSIAATVVAVSVRARSARYWDLLDS